MVKLQVESELTEVGDSQYVLFNVIWPPHLEIVSIAHKLNSKHKLTNNRKEKFGIHLLMQQIKATPQAPLALPPFLAHIAAGAQIPDLPLPSLQEPRKLLNKPLLFGLEMTGFGSMLKSWWNGLIALLMFDRPNKFWRDSASRSSSSK